MSSSVPLNTYRVSSTFLKTLTAKLDQLNKKALKMGKQPLTYRILSTENVISSDKTVEVYHEIEILGESPVFDRWTFVATLQHTEFGNIVRSLGRDLPESFRTASPYCDHCGRTRKRNDTYVVFAEDTSEYKQLGRSCITDFVGSTDINSTVKWLESLNELDSFIHYNANGGYSTSPSDRLYDLEFFLGFVASIISEKGYVNRNHATEQEIPTTGDSAWSTMISAIEYGDEVVLPTEAQLQLVKDAISWASGLADGDNLSDYLHNISLIASRKVLSSRERGYAASIIPTYVREMEKLNPKEEREDGIDETLSQHFGTLRKREVFTLIPTKLVPMETQFGNSTLCRFIDSNGNVAVWFASSCPDIEVGETYEIRATVKDHSIYNGISQTILTRCTILS